MDLFLEQSMGSTAQFRQEHSAKDFASYESYKRAGILYVFPPFITARMGQKDWGERPQTQLCGDAHGFLIYLLYRIGGVAADDFTVSPDAGADHQS